MRIIELDLERYGLFTGRKLTFRKDARLHLVYGPNEAGKSCSLSAITDLFFGIEKQTSYDFVHDGKDLRIGGLIERQDGHRLAFRRRKGNKNTLIGASDQSLGEHSLSPFLGSLSREVFCHAFGLNTDQLRNGAVEMLTSDGDVGASLFAAASGLRGLTELRRSLDADADLIFASRAAQNRSFYQALSRFNEARDAIRERELKASAWKELNQTIEEFAARLTEIKVSRAAKETERARLSRLKRVAPLLRLVDENRARLAALGLFPEVPAGFTKALRLSLEALETANQSVKRSETAETNATQDFAGITVDRALTGRAVDVQGLFSETVAYAKNLRDVPRIQAEADVYAGQLTDLSVRLGLAGGVAVEAARPADAAQALVRVLIDEGKSLIEDLNRKKKALSTERDALAGMEAQVTERGAVIDPRPLEQKFDALAAELREIDKYGEAELKVQAESRDLDEAASRLTPRVCNLEMFATAPLPGTETIARFRKELDGFEADIKRETHLGAESLKNSAEIEANLLSLRFGGPVPTVDAISAKRQQRDGEWTRLRMTLFEGVDALPGERLAEAVANFERYGSESDHLADKASTDAGRVATHTLQTSQLGRERLKEAETDEHLLVLKTRQHEVLSEWAIAWASVPIDPLLPSEMVTWLASLNGLLIRREKLKRDADELGRIESKAARIEPMLITIAREAALPQIQGLGAGALAAQIKSQLQSLSQCWHDSGDLDTRVREGKKRVEKLAVEVAQVEQDQGEWLKRWRTEATHISIVAAVSPDAAEAVLAAWKEVPPAILQRNDRAGRVAGMRREIADFESKAKIAVEELASDLIDHPFSSAVGLLNERLSEANNEKAKKFVALKRLTQTQREHVGIDADAREKRLRVNELMRGLPADLDPTEFLARVEERETISAAFDDRRENLLNQADGYSEEHIRADLVGFNPDQVEATLGTLSDEIAQLDQQLQEVFAAHDRKERERQARENGVGAEVAVQQRRNAEAELAGAAREWSILKLGSLMLSNVVERYRAKQQNPLIARAGEIFATVTGGSFAGIGQDYDEKDDPRIVGRRVSGETVPVRGMSDGTRDQLYLSLRLAYIEDYAGKVEPAPFICDDIFTTFDDARTTHALAALATIGNHVQTIVFTHHMHVAEIARKQLGPDLDMIELG